MIQLRSVDGVLYITCLSEDVKPTHKRLPTRSRLIETDTGKEFVWRYRKWREVKTISGLT